MDKKNKVRSTGMGVGYVSVMLIFAVTCLTVFAVMSFSAASANDGFNVRSGDYLKQYYTADGAAKSRLAVLDSIAKAAAETGFFEDEFEDQFNAAAESGFTGNKFAAEADFFNGITLGRIMNGYSAAWSEKINDRQELSVEVSFTSDGGCEVTRWQSRTISSEESSESHLGVWDGSFG